MRSLGIDVNSSSLRFVELEQKPEGVRLIGAATVPTFLFASEDFAPPGEEHQAARLAEVDELLERYSHAGVRVQGGVTGLTGRELMLRYVDVPEGDEKRQAVHLQFELDDILEQAEEALAYDHSVLFDPNASGSQTAVLALAKDAYLESYYERLARLKLKPRRVTPSCLALYHAFLLGVESQEEETVLILSVGCEESEFCLVRDGMLVFARNLNVGLKGLAEVIAEQKEMAPDKAYRLLLSKTDITPNDGGRRDGTRLQVALWDQAEQLHRALESSLTFARIHLKSPGLKLDRVLLAGDACKVTGARAYFQQRFRLRVEPLNPFGLLEDRAKQPDLVRRSEFDPGKLPGCYAVAAGLARIGLEKEPSAAVNLLSQAIKAKRDFVHRTVFLYGAAIAAVLMVLWLIVSSHELAEAADDMRREAQAHEQAMRDLHERLTEAHDDLEAAKPVVQALRATIEPTGHSLRVLHALRAFANDNPELIVERIVFEPPAGEDFAEPAHLRLAVFFENKGRLTSQDLIEALLNHLETRAGGAIPHQTLEYSRTEVVEGLGDRYEIRGMLATVTRQ